MTPEEAHDLLCRLCYRFPPLAVPTVMTVNAEDVVDWLREELGNDPEFYGNADQGYRDILADADTQ